LHQDFLSRGMYLVGGGAMLRGLDIRITRDTKVPVVLADQPLEAVVLGAGHCIENFDALEDLFMESRRG
jgi:rod shape-determining protein MreB